jgi:hypothetical protein
MRRKGEGDIALIGWLAGGTFALIGFCMWLFPTYGVWRQGLLGEAELERAKQTKQVMIEQAKAEKESAQLKADAIAIVGQASKDFPEYRKQEFIAAFGEAMANGNIQKIIYVPTEANIPIIERK